MAIKAYCGNEYKYSVNGSSFSGEITSWSDFYTTAKAFTVQSRSGTTFVNMPQVNFSSVTRDELNDLTNCPFIVVERQSLVSLIDRLGAGGNVENVVFAVIMIIFVLGLMMGLKWTEPRNVYKGDSS